MGFSKVMVTGLFLSSGPKVAVNRGQMLWRPGKMYNPSHSRDLPVMGEVISGSGFERPRSWGYVDQPRLRIFAAALKRFKAAFSSPRSGEPGNPL